MINDDDDLETPSEVSSDNVAPVTAATPTGRAKGGLARKAKLSPERRREIASKAGRARWGGNSKDLPIAEYVGELNFGGQVFPCAVLPDGTRVFSETDFMAGLGMYRSGALSVRRDADESSGAPIPLYLAFKNLSPFVTKYLGEVHVTPRQYRTLTGNIAHGIDAALIPRICSIWLDARKAGVLGPRQKLIADRAEMLMRSLAEVGIVALVDEATGYQSGRPRDALQRYLEMIVAKDLAVWAKKFPDEFYENIYKLRGWPWTGMKKNRYSAVAGYTRDLVYERMAPGLLKELEEKSPKDEKGNRDGKLHQWLTGDVGNPMLAGHLQSILTLQRLALANGWGWQRFMNMVNQVMQKKGQTLELPYMDFDASAM